MTEEEKQHGFLSPDEVAVIEKVWREEYRAPRLAGMFSSLAQVITHAKRDIAALTKLAMRDRESLVANEFWALLTLMKQAAPLSMTDDIRRYENFLTDMGYPLKRTD